MVQRKTMWGAKIIASTGEAMVEAMLRLRDQEKEIGRLRHHVSMLSKKLYRLQKFGGENGEGRMRSKEEVAREVAPSLVEGDVRVAQEAPRKEGVAEIEARVAPRREEAAERVALVVLRKEVAGMVVQEAPRKEEVAEMEERVAPRREEVAERKALMAPRKEVAGVVARMAPKRVIETSGEDGRSGETGWRVISRDNKKRLVERDRRVGFVFQYVEGCANNTPERDEFLLGVLDRVKAKKTHRGVVKMLLEGKGCLNCSFDWRNEDERIWIPGGGD
ncbi:hypothetical protein HOY82DRAFT_613181 [Tuber indicum]|nr:hypothetical protein HOY82DRAFT_613181 [Tuber indicum]